ncbi:hypothetical protein C1H46_038965 [Malus baccata]|uniref:F-box associated beta-propeller type 1 domain-containing protein n=1 Tax=Malus baccata TaxID=106549 RepID=A0A540KMQ4_MALBA|nr:hypothetical protein C1H46_038965 [Malus baccata]
MQAAALERTICEDSLKLLRPCLYGFGYDSVPDDYKVILGENSNASHAGKVVFFTLKRGSWRTVEGLNQDDDIQLQKRGLLLNGALHWLHHGLISSESSIISFNLAEEKFQELEPLSNIVNRRRNMRADIRPYRRSHLFCYLRGDDENMEIWAMMEYGVKESWTRLMLTQMDDHQPRPNYICVVDDDKVLMSYLRGDLILYDPKGQKTYWITLESRNGLVESAMYTETLVSPVAGK